MNVPNPEKDYMTLQTSDWEGLFCTFQKFNLIVCDSALKLSKQHKSKSNKFNSLPTFEDKSHKIKRDRLLVFDRWDIPSSKLQRWCSWLSERWQHISSQDLGDMYCSLCLTLDQQVVFSVARITGVANLPPKDVVWLKKHQLLHIWTPGLGVEPGSQVTKRMLYHWASDTLIKWDLWERSA